MRDYDKEPLIMKTEQFHLFLFEFVCCLIGIFIIYIALEDAFGERKRVIGWEKYGSEN